MSRTIARLWIVWTALILTLGSTARPVMAQEKKSWTDAITVSGDFRIRHEGFYNQKTATGADVPARNRERVRGRLGLNATINPSTSCGLRLATGTPGDPISTNQSLDNFFERPPFTLDRAYIRLQFKATTAPIMFSTDIGRFANPAYKASELVWDDDLNPNGITEKLTVTGKNTLKQFEVILMQYTVKEVSAGKDAGMIGAQARLALAPSQKVEVAFGVGDYKYFQTDVIATAKNSQVVGADGGPVGNRVVKTGMTITGFLSRFNMVNLAGEVTIKTNAPAYPVRLFGDIVINTQARADAAGNKDQTGLYAGVAIGRASNPGEVSLTGTYVRVRQDATLSTFSFSDVPADGRQGGMVKFSAPILPKTVVTLTGIVTKKLRVPAGTTNALLVRTQADLMVSF